MDLAVLKAMAKWPSVPSVYGWLALDRRGTWTVKGEPIGNPAVAGFISRNYERDTAGRWFFQNGPQRVFVTLSYVPFVLRVEPSACGPALVTHTGETVAACREALLDESGNLLIGFERGVGLISDRDLAELLPRLRWAEGALLTDDELESLLNQPPAAGRALLDLDWMRLPLHSIRSTDVASRFGFDPDPRPAPGEPEC